MGNSEVGHNALGAGRIFAQGAKLVNRAIADRCDLRVRCLARGDRARPSRHAALPRSALRRQRPLPQRPPVRDAAAGGRRGCHQRRGAHPARRARRAGRSALGYIERTEAVLAELNAGRRRPQLPDRLRRRPDEDHDGPLRAPTGRWSSAAIAATPTARVGRSRRRPRRSRRCTPRPTPPGTRPATSTSAEFVVVDDDRRRRSARSPTATP